LNYLVEVIMTTLNFTALLRYYKYKNWLMFCFIGIKRPLCLFCVFFSFFFYNSWWVFGVGFYSARWGSNRNWKRWKIHLWVSLIV
jgi:hypothetical protein